MKLDYSKRAQRDARRIDKWWREHADHPETFAQELLETLQHLITVNFPGVPCAHRAGVVIHSSAR